MWLWLLLAGCGAEPDLEWNAPTPFFEGEPTITQVDWGCDLDEMEWVFEVKTEQWSGEAWLRMAKSTEYAELHRMPSVEAAGDGSEDRLKLSLNIAQDWRAASSGSSTAWRCRDVDVLTYMITVYDTQGDAVTDCRTWGADTSIWSRFSNAYECPNILDIGQDTGE